MTVNIKYSVGSRNDIPCKGTCQDRHPGCHAECERYILWKKDLLTRKGTIFKNMKTQSDATAFFSSMKKIHNKRKGK